MRRNTPPFSSPACCSARALFLRNNRSTGTAKPCRRSRWRARRSRSGVPTSGAVFDSSVYQRWNVPSAFGPLTPDETWKRPRGHTDHGATDQPGEDDHGLAVTGCGFTGRARGADDLPAVSRGDVAMQLRELLGLPPGRRGRPRFPHSHRHGRGSLFAPRRMTASPTR